MYALQVVSEISQLRNGWSQAKAIIKQQRKTIKGQELQLQLLGTPAAWPQAAARAPVPQTVPQTVQPQQQYGPSLGATPSAQQQVQQVQQASTGLSGPQCMAETSDSVLKYPITSWVLQSQQQCQQQQHVQGATPAASAAAGGGVVAAAGVGPRVAYAEPQQLQTHQTQAAAGSSSAAGGHVTAAGIRQGVGTVEGLGVTGTADQRQQTVLARTSELLQCTDDILKTLRSRTAQC